MTLNNRSYIRYSWVLTIILILYVASVCGQSQPSSSNQNQLGSNFVKKKILQKGGTLSNNIVRVINHSDQATRIKPVLSVPSKWAVFSTSFIDTLIPAHDSISLPFSLRIPSVTSAVFDHKVMFQVFSSQNKLVLVDSFLVQAEPFKSWDAEVPDKRFFFYPKENKADLQIVLQNKGNVPQTIHLEIRPDKKLSIETIGGFPLINDFTLAPDSDSTLLFSASYSYEKKRVFDICKVQVVASSEGKDLYRAIIIEKYENTFAPRHINKNLAHEVELGFRSFSRNDEVLPYIKAAGVADMRTKGMFSYNFAYHDLTETENVIGNSYYRFLYTRKELNVGVGAFSSTMGRNLYSRNCIMLSNELSLSPASKLKGYASFGYIEPKSSIALGYSLDKGKISMKTALAYDMDMVRKINTGSFMHSFGKLYLHPRHVITPTLYSYYENSQANKNITQFGVAYDLKYNGSFGKHITLQLFNSYGSPNIPGPQMGLMVFGVFSRYLLKDRNKYLSFSYNNSSKDYYIRDKDGEKLPDIKLHDQYANLLYYSNANKRFKWSLGPSIEYYFSVNPLLGLGETKDFDLRKYRLEYTTTLGRFIRLNLKGGLSQESDDPNANSYSNKYDFHLLGDYSSNGYGVRLAYDYGPMVNTGLYQYALDGGNNTFLVSPYLLKNYLGGLIGLRLFTNFTYRIDLKYASLNVNPKIETYVIKNWYLVLGGTYNYSRQEFRGEAHGRSFFFVEFAVKKRWGQTGNSVKDKDLVRLKVLVFQDDNGNGSRDAGEKGISFVKTRIVLASTPDKSVRDGLPVDITLLSNDAGYTTFNRIPKGNYEVAITPLAELKEYFYMSTTVEKVEMLSNYTFEIPFQKAKKITGQIVVNRRKFIKGEQKSIDLKNIRITAYSQKGNSYSTFTDQQGRFILFAPGGTTYHLRMKNIFGSDFRILQNDISTNLSDSINSPIIFTVVESSRKLNIKKVKPADTELAQKKIQKIKVISGEVYTGKNAQKRVDKNSAPQFEILDGTDTDHVMVVGKFYVVVGHEDNREDALKVLRIFREMGINAWVGINDHDESFYVFTNYFDERQDTRKELSRLKGKKITNVSVYEYQP